MLKKSLLFVCLLVASSIAVAAGTLRVGMSADYPPLHFMLDGRFAGIEADNAKAVGKIMSRKMKIVQLPLEELVPALKAGKVDVLMSGLSVTAERSQQVAFTDAYLRVGQMAIMHKSRLGRFSQPWAVYREGVRIGVKAGSTGAEFAQRDLPDAIVSEFENTEQAFAALRKGTIDMYIHDAPTSWQLANGMDNDDLISLYSPLTEEMLAWAVRKEDGALLEELNRALTLMRNNGSLQYILNRWIPVTVEVK